MQIDFANIEYLKKGNKRQQQAYALLTKLSIFEKLAVYNPILTGTIPIEIDLPQSDLDIICQCFNHKEFTKTLTNLYSGENDFKIQTDYCNGILSTIATFKTKQFKIEIFGQDCPTTKQNAYKHMLIEHKILNSKNNDFKREIIKLKKEGLKTEPAFAKLLGLVGNPYEELLKIEV